MNPYSKIPTQDPSAAESTETLMGTREAQAAHEAAVASERQRTTSRQAEGVAVVKQGLDAGVAGVRAREAEREKTLTGPLGK